MILLDLPPEILRQIVEDSRPDGFESLATVCKLIFEIAKPLIEQYNHSKPYLSMDLGLRPPSTKTCDEVFFDVLEDPVKAQYPKYLRCYYQNPCNWKTDQIDRNRDFTGIVGDWLRKLKYIDRSLRSSKPFLRDQTGVPKIHYDLENWQIGLLIAYKGYLIPTLLLLLPNLEEITLSDVFPCERLHLNTMMEVVAQDAVAGCIHPLSHLHTICVSFSDDDHGWPIQSLAPFFVLPSLTKVVGHHLEADLSCHDYYWPYSAHLSNIEQFELTKSAITTSELQRILQPMHRLRTFKYSHMCWGRRAGNMWNAAGFLRCLAACVASTLEELSLTSDYASVTALGSFQGLTKLEKLELGLGLLHEGGIDREALEDGELFKKNMWEVPYRFPPDLRPDPRLGDILPPAIKEIVLILDSYDLQDKRLFQDFAVLREEKFSELHKIVFKCRQSTRSSMEPYYGDIFDKIKSAGVEAVFDVSNGHGTIPPAHHWDGHIYSR